MPFQKKKVLVAGDLLLDVYLTGNVKRISPEAPVPVLHVQDETSRPGGSGNVLLNLLSLEMEVVALGRIGDDIHGRKLLNILESESVKTSGIVVDPHFSTPVKKRLLASGQQLLRLDYEKKQMMNSLLEQKVIESFPILFDGVDALAISDYAKGFLTASVLQALIRFAKNQNIPVIVDPKGIDFSKYSGASLLKPNLSEALAAAGLEPGASLEVAAEKIFSKADIKNLIITRAHEGMTLFDQKNKKGTDFPVTMHEVKDVTGAGDTVLAVITAGIANGLPIEKIVSYANAAAGLAIERLGCARISLAELKARLIDRRFDYHRI